MKLFKRKNKATKVDEVKFREIYDKLPRDYSELKLKHFLELLDLLVEQDLQNENKLNEFFHQAIKIITGATQEDLEELTPASLGKIGLKLLFLVTTQPKPKKKSLFKWKSFEQMTYGDFILANTWLSKPHYQGLELILEAFTLNKLSKEQILEIDTQEAITAFFLLRKHTLKFLKSTQNTLQKSLKKQQKSSLGVTK